MAQTPPVMVKEIANEVSEDIQKRFAGIFKAVVPDVTKELQKAAQNFQKALVRSAGPRVDAQFKNLGILLNQYGKDVESLGDQFKDVAVIFDSLTKQKANALEEVEKLREKNLVAEAQLIIDKKTNQREYRAVVLTDAQVANKRKDLLLKDKELKLEEQANLNELRKYQKSGKDNTTLRGIQLSQEQVLLKEERELLEAEKKLYEGKGGRFDTRIGGFLDDFERKIQDSAPDFLVAVFDPIINTARQIQKTVTVIVDSFNFLKNGLLKILPDIQGFLTPVLKSFEKGLKSVGKGIESTINFFGGGLHKAVDGFGDGLLKASKGIQKSFLTVSEGFTSLFSGFGKSIGKVVGILATFGKRIILTGITMLAAIVGPLLPVLIPLLKFAAIVTGVVVAITLLKKGFDALTDWFKNSWLGKKIFGGDKGKEPEKEKTLASKDLNRMSMDETTLPEEKQPPVKKEKEKEKPKVITEKPLMPEPKPKSDVEKLYEEKANLDDMIQQSKDKSNAFNKEAMAELQKFKETGKTDEGLTGKEAEEYFAKKAAASKKYRESIIAQEKENQIAFDNELKKMGYSKEEADKLIADSKKADFEKPEIPKKEITPTTGAEQGQVVINNVTAPQNVASTSTQQVVAANAAKSNDDTFLNLNRHV